MPDEKERLIMFVIVGISTDEHCFSREVGIGSSSQCLSGDKARTFVTPCSVTGVKWNRVVG
jgi:hypothetical protein